MVVGMAAASSRSRSRTSSGSSPQRRRSQAKDVPASADMTPPPVKDEPAVEESAVTAEPKVVDETEPVGANLLRPTDANGGVVDQQLEAAAVGMLRRPGDRVLVDAVTGKAPDPDTMFRPVGFAGNLFESRVRLLEQVWVNDRSVMERLVVPAGRQVSAGGAAQIVAALRAQSR